MMMRRILRKIGLIMRRSRGGVPFLLLSTGEHLLHFWSVSYADISCVLKCLSLVWILRHLNGYPKAVVCLPYLSRFLLSFSWSRAFLWMSSVRSFLLWRRSSWAPVPGRSYWKDFLTLRNFLLWTLPDFLGRTEKLGHKQKGKHKGPACLGPLLHHWLWAHILSS